jgi:hypothetical protein
MRRAQLRIVEYRHSASSKYVIEGARVNGKRRRFFFATKTAAEEELARLKTKQRKEGENALRLPDYLRVMALESAEKLKPFKKTIQDACDFYVKFTVVLGKDGPPLIQLRTPLRSAFLSTYTVADEKGVGKV